MERIKKLFLKRDGGKKIVKIPSKTTIILGVTLLFAILEINKHFFQETSFLNKASLRAITAVFGRKKNPSSKDARKIPRRPRGVGNTKLRETNRPTAEKQSKRPKNVKDNSSQVIERKIENKGSGNTFPVGTSAVGITLNVVDTRRPTDVVRVSLPYGIKTTVPKNSILTGTATYKETEGNISLTFSRLAYPDGREFKIDAVALNPKDFSPGIKGRHHGNLGLKTAARAGLSAAGAMSEVLAKKEFLGARSDYGEVHVKSTLRDAALIGISQTAKEESRRQAESLHKEAQREYATLKAETALIVSLTETFREEEIR